MDSYCGSPFWDWNVTWNTDSPDLMPCFEKTVLVWLPSGFLCLFSIYLLYSARKLHHGRIPFSVLGLLQEAITIILVILQVIQFSFTFRDNDDPLVRLHQVDQAEPAIKAITFSLALLLQIYTKRKGIQSSAILFIFWLLTTICFVFQFQTTIRDLPLDDHNNNDKVYSIITLVSYPFIVVELALNFFADKLPVSVFAEDNLSEKHVQLNENEPCPQYLSSFPNQFTYQWVFPLLLKGYRKALELKDLWELNAEDKSFSVVERFNRYWKPELKKVQQWNAAQNGIFSEQSKQGKLGSGSTHTNNHGLFTKKSASILPALCKANFPLFISGSSFKLVQDLLAFVSPQMLNLLIGHLSEGSTEERWKGYLYMVIIFITVMAQTLCSANFSHRTYLTGMRLRATIVESVYQKSLLVSNAARKGSTIGEIVNLMSVDAQRFNDVMIYVNNVWSAPLQISLAIYFLWAQLGSAVLAGIVVLVLLIPVNIMIANKVKALKIEQMKNKDDRVRLTNEILSGIKVLKLYAWEPSFEDMVEEIRKKEIDVLKRTAYLDSFGVFVWFMAPFVVSLASFATYVLVDDSNVLDAKKAFVSLTLFNIMRIPMSALPTFVVQVVQTNVSLKRLNRFMNADEIDPESVTHNVLEDGNAVTMNNCTFSWDKTDESPSSVRNINLHIKKGSLVAVVGSVGSGKSSLLSAILGEMEKLSGNVNTNGSIAYVSQQAWIQNATLRDNILFGKRFNPVLYDKIIEACALKPDLKMLPAGDKTEIGEKGINLSGGQKQRISLARAAYNGAEMYLFDDPLSAVDSHVGKHLFQKVIGPRGLLHKKTRIVVTHGITYLAHVDQIFVMNNGEIRESGTFHELLSRKGAFTDFLIQHASVEDVESADSTVARQLEQVVGSKEEVFARQISQLSLRSKKGKPSELTRRDSAWSTSSTVFSSIGDVGVNSDMTKIEDKEPNVLIEQEKTAIGGIKQDVYTYYMRSMSWNLVLTSIASYVVMSGLSLYSSMWLAEWSTLPSVNGTQDLGKRDMYLGVYGGLGAGQAIAIFLANITMSLGCLKAATFLQKHMLTRILRSPMSFFDTTPLGRIVNRFSKDVDVADNTFPQLLYIWMSSFFQVLSTLIVISIDTPFFIIVIVPIGVIYIAVQRFYVSSSRQLKRLESVSRSPVFSHFSETLAGLSTIRAFKAQHEFLTRLETNLDQNQSAYFPFMCSNRWLSVLLESIGNLVVLFATLFALLSTTDEGSVGLSVSYALSITTNLNWLVRVTLEIETNIVAVERIKEYSETPQEAAWEVEHPRPPPNWPQEGNIVFKNYQSRYRDGLDLVLRGITCHILPGEKVGIVGRTGAGKSSLTLGLFRIVEAAGGLIEIDGNDISTLGLHDVRSRLTIIPQDPVLFGGTLRLNLDPYGKYSDDAIWKILELAHLKTFVTSQPGGLGVVVNENGENFSVGQRQLVCLARALLRKTKILILDEATAAVDLETDDLIQKTIRSEFNECTVLTIAHRLNTIMDCNRIMVLDKGEISEFDSPQNLLTDKQTIFYSMAKDAGLS